MQYHNADRAVVFQSNNSIERLLKEAEVRRVETERARREQEQKDIQMTSLVGDAFNDKHYLTGTGYDPFFQKELQSKRAKYAELIKNNSLDVATVQQMVQKDMNDIAATSVAVKNFRSGLKEYVKSFDPKSGMLPRNIEALAMKKFLFKPDGSLKDPESLAGTPDELAQMIVDENPELVVNESIALSGINKSFEDAAYDYKRNEELSKKGTTKKHLIDFRLYPYQEFDRSPGGKIKTDQEGNPIVKVKSQQVKDKSGSVIGEELSDDVFSSFTSSPQGVALVQAKFKYINNQLKATGRTPIQDGTPEAVSLKKQIVHGILSQNRPLKDGVVEVERDAAGLQSLLGGYRPPRAPQEDNSEEKFENTSTGRLIDISTNGIDTSGLDVVTHGTGASAVKGFSVKGSVGKYLSSSGKEYTDIVYDPSTKTFSFIPEELGAKVKKVSASEMPTFLKGNYKINGVKNEDAQRIDGKKTKVVRESDIASIAAKYVNPSTGRVYTEKEYREALIKAGVTITK